MIGRSHYHGSRAVAVLAGVLALGLSSVALAERPHADVGAGALDISKLLPAPPRTGSELEADDRRVFRETRALVGTPRWNDAIADTDETTPSLLLKFSSAAGRDLTGTKFPHVQAVPEHAAETGAETNDRAKQVFKRLCQGKCTGC